MSNFKGFRSGSKLSKADVQRRVEAYNKKLEEYSKLSLEELKELYPILRGVYKMACENITMQKLNAARETGFTEEETDDMEVSVGGAITGE